MFDSQDMIFETKLSLSEVMKILKEQMDERVSWLRIMLTLNDYGTSAVIGSIRENVFYLRNRRNPFFSVAVIGRIIAKDHGSEIHLTFKKSKFRDFLGDFLFKRSEHDKMVIIRFLKEWLFIKEKIEPSASQGFGPRSGLHL